MPHANPAGPARPPRVAVVVVTYNSANVLRGCLDSILPGADGAALRAVVVADNASRDESVGIAKDAAATLPLQVIETGRNGGYSAAINAGTAVLDLDDLDAVFIMNPDCRFLPGALATLAGALAEDPDRRGIAVPRLSQPDGTLQGSLFRQPSVARVWMDALVGGRRSRWGEKVIDPDAYTRAHEVSWATGAAQMHSVETIRRVGPWDESFLLYSEETEYALRAADHGLCTWYEPAAGVVHLGGESDSSPMLYSLLTVNRVRLFRRRQGTLAAVPFFVGIALGELLRALAGRRTSRAALAALLLPSHRIRELKA
ncbi:glycosyltransferase family 2 protein [Actinomadura harenae]|uniref:Glycosyltransferase family 2 protein n=1 Tax=Actinomadura harenae TaxID=2483351 RepID=A0A3M2LX35_9ACTN|nr:glycosyltransferase family 2 protein [Actinomadura harenae]RMI41470.1 glycosyltransferase family 2 protein [Actinomadura harenae]